MKRGKDDQSAGQIVYELLASNDKTSQHWPEWHDLSIDQKEEYETIAVKVIHRWQGEKDDSDKT